LTTRTIDRLFAGALLLLGLHIVWNALEYGYMRGTTPGPGFFPFWVGLALAIFSAVNLVRSMSGAEVLDSLFDAGGFFKALAIVASIVVFILITPILGLLLGTALLIPVVAFIIRRSWTPSFAATIAAIALVFPVIGHFLFGVYLQVPLVKGPFGF
jgi:hypothetical protein